MSWDGVIWGLGGLTLVFALFSVLWPGRLARNTVLLERYRGSRAIVEGMQTLQKLAPVLLVALVLSATAVGAVDFNSGHLWPLSPVLFLFFAGTALAISVWSGVKQVNRLIAESPSLNLV